MSKRSLRLSPEFVKALLEIWEERGAEVLRRVREQDPVFYEEPKTMLGDDALQEQGKQGKSRRRYAH